MLHLDYQLENGLKMLNEYGEWDALDGLKGKLGVIGTAFLPFPYFLIETTY